MKYIFLFIVVLVISANLVIYNRGKNKLQKAIDENDSMAEEKAKKFLLICGIVSFAAIFIMSLLILLSVLIK